MTIAEKIRAENKGNSMRLMFECQKQSVSRKMDGPDIKVFTFSDGSKISLYWS